MGAHPRSPLGMGSPRSPVGPTGLTQEDYNWRRIYAVSIVYVVIIIIANVRTAWVSRPVALVTSTGSQDMRPPLFASRPTTALSQRAARVVDPHLFDGAITEGLQFIDDMKNPCWNDTGTLQCLPYFYVLGPFQAGVRDLEAKMLKHPDIVRTANPEPHFWSENRPTNQFLSGMAAATDTLAKAPASKVIGDWSASYFAGYWAMQARTHQAFYSIKVHCWERCKRGKPSEEERAERLACVKEQCYEPSQQEDQKRAADAGLEYEQMQTPLLMHAVYNGFDPKFVVMLRNPTERLHSAFWTYGHYWERYGGRSPQGFLNYINEQIEGFHNCTDLEGHSTFQCALYLESLSQNLEDIFFHCDQLMRGMYSIWLHLWFSFFPRESFLVLKAEDYFVNPRGVLSKILAHLKMPEPTANQWERILDASDIRTAAAGHDMLPEARQAIERFYAPFNDDLAELLGSDDWKW